MQMHTVDNNNAVLLFAEWFQFEKPSYLYHFIWNAEQPWDELFSPFLGGSKKLVLDERSQKCHMLEAWADPRSPDCQPLLPPLPFPYISPPRPPNPPQLKVVGTEAQPTIQGPRARRPRWLQKEARSFRGHLQAPMGCWVLPCLLQQG